MTGPMNSLTTISQDWGELIADGLDISDLLIERQLAVPYDGVAKGKDWCG